MAAPLKLLLDSVILIDHLNGVDRASRYIERHAEQIAISVISRVEVMVGVRPRALKQVRRFLDLFPNLEITLPVAERAADLRRKHRWKLPDAFQAALARHHRLRLVTRDARDFNPTKHRFVVIPYSL